MPDFDIYRIEELPKDELGGASGEKRKFRLEFIGKAPNERFPYTVANEVVSSFIGTVLGFNIPTIIPHRLGGDPLAMVLWMKPAAREQKGPPLTSRELQQFLALHEDEIHGAIVLDLYSGENTCWSTSDRTAPFFLDCREGVNHDRPSLRPDPFCPGHGSYGADQRRRDPAGTR